MHFPIVAVVLSAVFCLSSQACVASPETDEAKAKVRALGKRWDGEVNTKTKDAYLPLLKSARRDGVTVTRDVKYSPDERHRLDVYEPLVKPAKLLPVMLYVHGGGLTGGDKDSPGTTAEGFIYGNIGTFFAQNGMVGVNATYRLMPKAKYPDGAEDVASMMRWAKANVAKHGGDPDAIFIFGHSAGGTLVGGYLYNQSVQPNGDPSVAGALLLSPAVGGERTGPREKIAAAYYGEDRSKWVENVPLGLYNSYKGRKVPTMFVIAEYDPPEIEGPTVELMSRICAKEQACPYFTSLRGHNHVSHALSLTTDDPSFGTPVLDFVKRTLVNRK